MKCRSSARIVDQEKKKLKLCDAVLRDSVADRLGFVLELGSGAVMGAFLSSVEASNLIQACFGVLPAEFVETLSLAALDQFATENKIHVGRHCICDWMRTIDFKSYDVENCFRVGPFTVNKSIPALEASSRAPALLSALTLAKRVFLPYCVNNRRGAAMFAPVVCLLTENGEGLCSAPAVKQAMNRACKRAGTRFFYKFTAHRTYTKFDLIFEHWDSIEDSTCVFCNNLPQLRGEHRLKWRDSSIQRIRDNCAGVYRPLKAAMEKELRFVRFIPRPNGGNTSYEGLVAGISTQGAFCGLYLVNGFWPYNFSR